MNWLVAGPLWPVWFCKQSVTVFHLLCVLGMKWQKAAGAVHACTLRFLRAGSYCAHRMFAAHHDDVTPCILRHTDALNRGGSTAEVYCLMLLTDCAQEPGQRRS